ncbi:MAG: NADH-quinone oxidoreductase subunit H [Thermoprotei archaeon]|nr:MAG: NADH-quinone oxidoreductase subunit H [Thermoprotei archaeon]
MVQELIDILKILIFPGFFFFSLLGLFFEWIDRKFYAKLQNRVGPLYTGPSGLFQPFADFVKLMAKEDIVPEGADKPIFSAIPVFALALSLFGVLFLPVYGVRGIVSFEGDIIVLMAIMTIFVMLVFLAGFTSASRYSEVGAERSILQLLGYEIPLVASVLGTAAITASMGGSLSISGIVQAQSNWWGILGIQALGFAIFILAAQAELERVPFDIPEAETEIVAGWLTEFSGKKLALIRLARDIELAFLCGLAATVFLGGPQPILLSGIPGVILGTVLFLVKSIVVLLILTTVRAAMARLRIDQMVNFAWKYLVPLSVLQLFLAVIIPHVTTVL